MHLYFLYFLSCIQFCLRVVFCLFKPLPPDQNTVNIFKDLTVGTNVPKPFIPGVRKGFEIMAQKGT